MQSARMAFLTPSRTQKIQYYLGLSRPSAFVFTFTEIYMKKRSDKNSKTSAMAEFVGAIYDTILSPAGMQVRDDKEHLICKLVHLRSSEGRLP